LNRRDTHIITVSPKDEYRYGYRLWIDDSTAMPLKTQLCDTHGHVIEQIVFASLTLPSRIPHSALRTGVSTELFPCWRNESTPLPVRLLDRGRRSHDHCRGRGSAGHRAVHRKPSEGPGARVRRPAPALTTHAGAAPDRRASPRLRAVRGDVGGAR